MVDIDGTICGTETPPPDPIDYAKQEPMKDRIAIMNRLFDEGHEVHYWTARGAKSGIDWHDVTVKQLADWGVKYTSLRVGDKPHYDIWVDDKARNDKDFFREEKFSDDWWQV